MSHFPSLYQILSSFRGNDKIPCTLHPWWSGEVLPGVPVQKVRRGWERWIWGQYKLVVSELLLYLHCTYQGVVTISSHCIHSTIEVAHISYNVWHLSELPGRPCFDWLVFPLLWAKHPQLPTVHGLHGVSLKRLFKSLTLQKAWPLEVEGWKWFRDGMELQ